MWPNQENNYDAENSSNREAGAFPKIDGDIYESGNWDISTQKADELIGGDIYFHKKQKEPSFYGGKILGYRIYDNDDELKGRIIFRFEYSRSHKAVLAGDGGWSYEKKINIEG